MSKKIVVVLISCMLILSSCQVEELITEEQYNAVLEENQSLLDQLTEKDQQISELTSELDALKSGTTENNSEQDETLASDDSEASKDEENLDEPQEVEQEIIYVGSGYELIQALRSNAIFFLNPGNYDLSTIPDNLSDHFSAGVISNLENVSFMGNTTDQLEFVTEDPSAVVLQIENSRNITIQNLFIGHRPALEFSCQGEVLILRNIENIVINDTTLYGCGTIGLYGRQLSNMVCREVTITDCSSQIMDLAYSANITFEKCDFVSRKSEHIYLDNLTDTTFKNCNLVGGFTNPPKIFYSNELIVDTDERDVYSIIDDFEYEGVNFTYLRATGNELIGEIEAIYEGLTVDLRHSYMDISGETASFCTMTYEGDVPVEDLRNHRAIAAAIIDKYYKGNEEKYTLVLFQEVNGLSIYEGRLFERGLYIEGGQVDIAKFLGTDVDYISYDAAKTIITQNIPSVYAVDGEELKRIEDKLTVELGKIVIDESVYYMFNVTSNIHTDVNYRDLYIDAVTGEVFVEIDTYLWDTYEAPEYQMMSDFITYWKTIEPNKTIGKVVFYYIKDEILAVHTDIRWRESYFVNMSENESYSFDLYWEFEGD